MAARRHINRYRTEPFGKDRDSVLKRGKAFFTIKGYGGTSFHDPFMLFEYNGIWHAMSLPGWGSLPKDATIYKWDGKRWQATAT